LNCWKVEEEKDMAARRKKQWKKILPTIALTAIPFTADCPAANAFFPPVTPPPPHVVVVPPVSPPPIIVVPPVSPPPFSPPPPPHVVVPPVSPPPIVVPPVSPPNTNNTPEPATLLTGMLGLAAVAGYRLVRRKENEGEKKSE
jgi:hypothetical protein